MYVCNIRHFFLSFFAPLGPLGLILGQHFLKKCSNAAIPFSGNFLGGPKKTKGTIIDVMKMICYTSLTG